MASRQSAAPRHDSAWKYWVGVWTAAVLIVCLTPTSGGDSGPPWFCVLCGERAARDLVLNVLLFLPLGFGLGRMWGRLAPVVATGFFLSLGIELAQLVVPGRFSALGDVLANTAGAWVGGRLGAAPRAWIFPDPPALGRIRWAWSAGAAGLILLSGILLLPSTPDGVFYGNWTPEVGGRAPYPGRMLSASLGSYPIPSERLEDSDRVMAALEAEEPLVLRFVAGPNPESRAALFRLIGEGQREVIRIDVDGPDVLVHPRYMATRFRLSRPELRFVGALAGPAPGAEVTMTIRTAPAGGVELDVSGRPPMIGALGPAQGWVVFSDIDGLPGPVARLADILWVLVLFFPLGWWSNNIRALAASVLPAFVAVVAGPAATPLVRTPLIHLALAAVFSLTGYVFARRLGSENQEGRAPAPP